VHCEDEGQSRYERDCCRRVGPAEKRSAAPERHERASGGAQDSSHILAFAVSKIRLAFAGASATPVGAPMIPMSCSFVLPGAAWHHLAGQLSATARGTLLEPPAPEHPTLNPTTTRNGDLFMRLESSLQLQRRDGS